MLPPVFVDLVAGAWHDDRLSRAMNAAVVAAVLALSLVVTPGAVALPGDPGFVASSPADGAALPIDPGGIGVAYTCPVYRSYDAGGGFVVYGGPKDYGVSFGVVARPSAPTGRPGQPESRSTTATRCPGEQDSRQSAMYPGGLRRRRPQGDAGDRTTGKVWAAAHRAAPRAMRAGPGAALRRSAPAARPVPEAAERAEWTAAIPVDRDGELRGRAWRPTAARPTVRALPGVAPWSRVAGGHARRRSEPSTTVSRPEGSRAGSGDRDRGQRRDARRRS